MSKNLLRDAISLIQAKTIKRNTQSNALHKSKLFDISYYIQQARDSGIIVKKTTAVDHYIEYGDSIRLSPHPIFDVHFYHSRYEDIQGSGMTALFHFIMHGASELRQPHPLFDMKYVAQQISDRNVNPLLAYLDAKPGTLNPHPELDELYIYEQLLENYEEVDNTLITFLRSNHLVINPNRDFDMHAYINLNPDIRPYNGIYHYVIAGKQERRSVFKASSSLNGLEKQINLAAELDIDIAPPNTDILALHRSYALDEPRDKSTLLRSLQSSIRGESVDFIFFIPHLVFGGTEKVIVNILKALNEIDSNCKVLLVVTDSSDEGAVSWLPRQMNLYTVNISPFITRIPEIDILRIIGVFIQISRCKKIFVANSRVGWDLIEFFGKSISTVVSCNAFVFCYDYDKFGRKAGYAWTHLSHCVKYLDHVYTDNTIMGPQIARDLRLSVADSAKFYVIPQPAEAPSKNLFGSSIINKADRRYKKKSILWAGRFHKQKNIAFAISAASYLTEYDFTFAGGFANDEALNGCVITENMNFIGPYDGIDALPLDDVNLFFYSSDWDGLPNILLEIGARGIPIIARDVGGISDLLNESNGWLVNKNDSPEKVASLIRSIMRDDKARSQKSAKLLSDIKQKHSWKSFSEIVRNTFSQ